MHISRRTGLRRAVGRSPIVLGLGTGAYLPTLLAQSPTLNDDQQAACDWQS